MISLLLPTRKRPQRLAATIDSVYQTAENLPEILVYVADDDDAYDEFRTPTWYQPKIVRGPRVIMSDLWNQLLPHATGDIFMLCADDVIFHTPRWDVEIEKVFEEVSDKILLAYADDGGPNGKNFASLPFVSRRWTEIVGYFTGPGFSADFSDTWPQDVAQMIERKKFVPVLIEHCHPAWNKAEMDVVYRENEERKARDNPHNLYAERLMERIADAAKLRAAIGTPWQRSAPVTMRWSILILTQRSREEFLRKLLSTLVPQAAQYRDVEIKVRTFDKALDLGTNRQKMIDEARGEYVSFIDDDDKIHDQYVSKIRPLLDGVSSVGFNVRCYNDGNAFATAKHSLAHKGWSDNGKGTLLRDITHLNPVRRELALRVRMSGGRGEDYRWAAGMRELGILKDEHYIDEVLYDYYFRTRKPEAGHSIVGGNCPYCHTSAFPASYPGGIKVCNMCGKSFHA